MTTESEHDPGLDLIDRQINRAKKLNTNYLECRVGGLAHAWHLVQPDWKPGRGIRAVAQQCTRCRTVKRYECSKRYGLMLAPPTYQYPKGYQLKKAGLEEPVISANAVRAVLAKRMYGELPDIEPLDWD